MASIPAEQAPERMISAFSMMVTRTLGSTRAASVATKQPGIAAADDEQVGLDDDGLDIVQVFRGELAHVRRRDVGHDVLL